MSTATGGPRGRLRSATPFVLLGIALVLAVVLTGGPPDRGLPLDPRSSGPLGTKALVDVLGELGVDVEIGDDAPDRAGGVVLLLSDQLDEARRDRLLRWVSDGGRLIVADPASPLTPEVSSTAALGFATPSIAPGDCDLAALADVGRVTVPGAAVYQTPKAAVGCYPRNEGAWLVTRSEGAGTVVSLGGPATFTNLELGREDNAALAGALLTPDGTVTILEPPPPGAGDATLLDLIAPRVRLAIVQLLIAFAIVVGWRARRLGRPLVEPSPVEVPGSELVVAVGNLFQASGAADHAADVLREDARRTLAERLGVPPSASAETLAETAAARTGASAEEVLAVIGSGENGAVDDERLVSISQAVEDVRRALATPNQRKE